MDAAQMTLLESDPLCAFIEHHLATCKPETYALIYVYTYHRFTQGGADGVSLPEIAARFEVKEDFIVSAWRHWEDEGLLRITHKNGETRIAFNAPRREADGGPAASGGQKAAPPSDRPAYTADELSVYRRQSKDVERLFKGGEEALGKLLNYNDMNVLFGLYDWLRLPLDVILYLLTYCAERGHSNLRYIEKAALDWADHQIDDLEKALAYVQGFDRSYQGILQAMGQTAGYPTPSQRKYIDKWLHTFCLPAALVLDACDRAALQIGKPKFTYVDKILEDWHKKGFTTLAEVNADAEARRKSADSVKAAPKTRAKSRFVNFNQRDRNYQQLEKMEREYLTQKVKGL